MTRFLSFVPAVVACLALAASPGCSSKPKSPRVVRPPVVKDLPPILQGTVGAMVTVRQAEPVIVSGYGLVVGLNGTGGGLLDERVAATMERELGLRGVGTRSDFFKGTAFEGLTPRQLLRRKDVAVAVVYAALPPGAPDGAEFDVYVRAVNDGGAASLEGGTLWTTDLHLGPPSTFGGHNTRLMGRATGPVFINPFAEPPAPDQEDATSRSIGRVLGGGRVTNSANLVLVLDNPSHSRARSIQDAIRDRFPEGPEDRGPIARGRDDSAIEVTVPFAYRDRAGDFLRLLLHAPVDTAFPQDRAKRYADALREQPGLADDLSLCLEAVGKPAQPFLRELYDSGELKARLAALRAGAALQDPRAASSLQALAKSGPPGLRNTAITLLGDIDAGPTVDIALRELLYEPELDIRVAAYEALAQRAEMVTRARLRAIAERDPNAAPVVDHSTRIALAGDTIQGVRRKVVARKFLLDTVPEGDSLVYVTQQGSPRITLFGSEASLDLPRPVLASIWSGRLMIAADSATDDIRVYYRDPRTGRGIQGKPGNTLPQLIEFMAHEPSPERPETGLSMSYSDIVGALYALQRVGGIQAPFATEEDRLMAAVTKANQANIIAERPESEQDQPVLTVFEPVAPVPSPQVPKPEDKGSLVVPIPPKTEARKPQR